MIGSHLSMMKITLIKIYFILELASIPHLRKCSILKAIKAICNLYFSQT